MSELTATAEAWFRTHTFGPPLPTPRKLALLKGDTSVSVCLPALNEEATIGSICELIRSKLMDEVGLVDELVVVDSGSVDATKKIASAAGAEIVDAARALPGAPIGADGGKGAALWTSLHAATGDIVVWLDADVTNFGTDFVCGLLWPLLKNADVHMAKAIYERPLRGQSEGPPAGGRVTELTARPLLRLLVPELAGVIQPLAGECAIRRATARSLPFLTGFGVDVALLIDLVAERGLDALTQVDLGSREHRNKSTEELGRMAFEVARAILVRAEALGRIKLSDPLVSELVQFNGEGLRRHELAPIELPPMELYERSRAEPL